MTDRTRINFHCHSDLSSDGVYSPETLAAMLARDNVQYASLTDHDSIDGYERFSKALEQHEIGYIPGVEIAANFNDSEIHFLAYGFNPSDPELRLALHNIRKQRRLGIQSVITSLKTTLKGRSKTTNSQKLTPPPHLLSPYHAREIIKMVHQAGGLVFLAHPFAYTSDSEEVTRIVQQLKEIGLDGIEAFSPKHSSEQREQLLKLANKESLLLTGGTDLHGPDEMGKTQTGINIPTRTWKEFRNAIQKASTPRSMPHKDQPYERIPTFRLKQLAFRFALPCILTICLFLFVCFAILIPALENSLMQNKRETVREFTANTMSLLQQYDEQVKSGKRTKEDAQRAALERIGNLRYGPEGKDYFWIIDKKPSMLMQPYRKDLIGKDLSTFRDQNGKLVFIDAVNAVKQSDEAYIDYTWQWKDDPSRLAPKLSHIRYFAPWGWIVGTGMYIDDVQQEIATITEHLIWSILLITVLVAGLLVFIVHQSLRLEQQRSRVEKSLRESHEKYRLLVESTTEGTLLLIDGKCAFANQAMLEMLGYESNEIPLLDWHDLLPYATPEDHPTVRYLTDVMEGKPAPIEHVGQLRRKRGDLISVRLSCQSLDLDNRRTLVLSARDVESIDPTSHAATGQDLKAFLEEMQSSLLFFNEPLSHFRHATISCTPDTAINDAARRMTEQKFSAILVVTESGDPVGIVTDSDLRRRVLTHSYNPDLTVSEIMSTPLQSIDENSLLHSALLYMQKKGIRHLALRDTEDNVTGIVRSVDLLAFHRYASTVLVSEIERAKSFEDIIEVRKRLPHAVASLVNVASKPDNVTRLISSVHDAIITRFMRLAMDEIGPPPVRFAFIGMGSHGREEETLVTSYDNGIIYQEVEPERRENVHKYFLALGNRVCDWLNTAGYEDSPEGIIARSSEWCCSINEWEEHFKKWIDADDTTYLLRFEKCFDFRYVYGADELPQRLRLFIFDCLDQHHEKYRQLSQYLLQLNPSSHFAEKTSTNAKGKQQTLDLQKAMLSIVRFARIYAWRNKLFQTNTLQRLKHLLQLEVLPNTSYSEIVHAYEFLMDLRLRHQINLFQSEHEPDNHIHTESITHIEETTLRESLSMIAAIQERLREDFS